MTARNWRDEYTGRVEWIRAMLRESGAEGIVYGNSGGKDSALVGILCKAACDNTVGLIMPCGSKRNYHLDMEDGLAVAAQYRIETRVADLTAVRETLFLAAELIYTDLRAGNMQYNRQASVDHERVGIERHLRHRSLFFISLIIKNRYAVGSKRSRQYSVLHVEFSVRAASVSIFSVRQTAFLRDIVVILFVMHEHGTGISSAYHKYSVIRAVLHFGRFSGHGFAEVVDCRYFL